MRRLRDVEGVLLDRYRAVLQGAVLELAPGGSRLTDELVHHARSYTGIGPSIAVINVCRQVYPCGTFIQGDLAELGQFAPGSLNAVLAWRCAIDGLEDQPRRELLSRVRDVLDPGGVLIFSSHNRVGPEPEAPPETLGRRGGHLFRGFRLRSSRAPMDERELGAELRSGIDGTLDPSQYRITRDDQQRQLGELGFDLAECLDLNGRPVGPGDAGGEVPELHYVARPVQGSLAAERES